MPMTPRTAPGRRPLLPWAVACLAWLLGLVLLSTAAPTSAAPAQDEPAKVADDAPAAKAAEGNAGNPAAGVAVTPQRKSYLMWAIEASGIIGLFIVLLSIYFAAVVVGLFLEFRMQEAVPPLLVEQLEAAIRDRKFQEAYDLCRDDNSYLARLVRTGVANLPGGRAEAKEAMNTVSDEIVVGMEQKISYLATIGTLGPMIGLVGTIAGMIDSFQTIATAAGTQPRADQVAKGISMALFITLEGVSLAVPAIFFFALFRNRIASIAMEANKVADRTINAFWNAAKQGQPAAAPGAAAPAKPQGIPTTF
ncbi:MAG: MotA/TolQ/ExbB proton channel family protein [Isosphaeraceae bacterium]